MVTATKRNEGQTSDPVIKYHHTKQWVSLKSIAIRPISCSRDAEMFKLLPEQHVCVCVCVCVLYL